MCLVLSEDFAHSWCHQGSVAIIPVRTAARIASTSRCGDTSPSAVRCGRRSYRNVRRPSPATPSRRQRHNAFLAAATLRRYLDEMHGDLFLGLLAYNIGPRNGGLRAIMEQYGARDFATIQPYLNT